MRPKSAFLMIWVLSARLLWAQFDLLTPHEASTIVERLPPVVEAAKKLPCPILADATGDPWHSATFDVAVRAACRTSTGSSLIDRYVVDRRTGVVTTWGDNPSRVGDRSSEVLAEQLVTQARSRRLSMRESRCLALEAARSLPGWASPVDSITFVPWGASGSAETSFQLRHKSVTPPMEDAALLFVDPETGHVRNGGSFDEVMAPGLGELLAMLIALRSPPLLSDQDALSIVLKVPVLGLLPQRKDCSFIISSALTPEKAQIAAACDGQYLDRPRVVVNLRNGLVSDANTWETIDTPEASQLAGSLVSAVRDARLHLQKEIDTKCGGTDAALTGGKNPGTR